MSEDGERPPNLSARTLGGLKWSYLASAGKALLSLLVVAILSRLLAPSDFGLFGIAWIFVALTDRFGQIGVGPALVQRATLTARHIEVGFTLSVTLGAGMTATLWLAAPLCGRLFDESLVAQLLRTMAVAFVIAGAGVAPAHMLRRTLRFKRLMVADLLTYGIGYGLTTLILAFQGFGVWALVWGEIMRRVVYTVIVICSAPQHLRLRLSAREAGALLSRGTGFSLMQVFDFIVRQGASFVIGRQLGPTVLGYYSRADRLMTLLRHYVTATLFEVLFPAMARRQLRLDRLGTIYLHGAELLSLVAVPVSVLLIVAAPELVAVLLGPQWDAVVTVLQVLALMIVFQACDFLNVMVVHALGAVYHGAPRQAVHAFLVVGGVWAGIRWGVSGAAAAIVGAQIASYLLMTPLALSRLGVRWRTLLRRQLPALWVGFWVTPALWLAAHQVRSLVLPAGIALLIEVLIVAAATAGALYFAPAYARLSCVPWVLRHVNFAALGAPGRWFRSGLIRMSAR